MNDHRIMATLRFMAWRRAVGELKSMLSTFWDGDEEENYNELNHTIYKFIEEVENNFM